LNGDGVGHVKVVVRAASAIRVGWFAGEYCKNWVHGPKEWKNNNNEKKKRGKNENKRKEELTA
jgi:hypothetical protein